MKPIVGLAILLVIVLIYLYFRHEDSVKAAKLA